MISSTGRPLMPPLSLTQSKYACTARPPSEKSVPGCLVLIAPNLIGSPLAFSPLPSPHLGASALTFSAPPPSSSSSPPQAATRIDRATAVARSRPTLRTPFQPAFILIVAPSYVFG